MKKEIPGLLLLFLLIQAIFPHTGCTKFERVMKVLTGTVSDTTSSSAVVSGVLVDPGDGAKELGHYYSKIPGERQSGSWEKSVSPLATGEFSTKLTGLDPETEYYVKAYICNGVDTVYGDEISFMTLLTSMVYDVENNTYNTISIGNQLWMMENLKTTKYNDGTAITYPGTDNAEWQSTTSGAYAWYNNDEIAYKNTYGALYNWYAVNTGKLCPSGWRIPSVNDWTILADYLLNNGYGYQGSGTDIGKSLASRTGWNISSTPGNVGNDQAGNNSSGFTVLPSGSRDFDAIFRSAGMYGTFWAADEKDSNDGWTRFLYFDSNGLTSNGADKNYGFSVRCIKN